MVGPATLSRPAERRLWVPRFEGVQTGGHWRRTLGVAIGIVLFVIGLIVFADLQTQGIFKDTIAADVSEGTIPRNDGGILFGALLVSGGGALMFSSLSRLPMKRRLVPVGLFMVSTVILLFTHFTIFVNGIISTDSRQAILTASFLFHDTAKAQPVAPFTLALLTLVLLVVGALAAMRLVTPQLLDDQILRPRALHPHRTRLVALTLFVAASGAGYAWQFLEYALNADATPSGIVFGTTLVVAGYYLLTFVLLLALSLIVWRTYLLGWGDMRYRKSLNFRRGYQNILNAENWSWMVLGLITLGLFLASPAYQPDAGTTDHVFAMNSKGATFFFLLLTGGAYLVHRKATDQYLTFLRTTDETLPVIPRDPLLTMALTLGAVWAAVAILLMPADLSPLTKLIVRFGAVVLVAPFFMVRFSLDELARPRLRPGAPALLLLVALTSVLVGIMLWGAGNSVTTMYSRGSGGFVTPEGNMLQPYATGIRLLGSLFIAVPLTLTLWYVVGRFERQLNPAPLLTFALSVVIGMNLLLTINAGDPFDPELGQTSVLIGFKMIELTSPTDRALILGAWSAIAAIGFAALAVLLARGAESAHTDKAMKQAPS